MKWIIPKRRDQEIYSPTEDTSDFNTWLPENDGNGGEGGVCIAKNVTVSVRVHEADEDITNDRVKRFDDPDSMLESLKQPW